ncbi:MAG: T9SS type A sorting domain-containing protein [Candidatus Cloacimonetes bacterium]|nr:T9SS type A sorting domain-containing protein [Candidatus Cloacimonadota bacterium]
MLQNRAYNKTMKRTLLTLLLLISSFSLMWAADINYKFTNSTVNVVNDKIYYEFDILAWVDNSIPVVLNNGMIYVEYHFDTFGDSLADAGRVFVQKQGPLANDDRDYSIVGVVNNKPNVFCITFEAPGPPSKSTIETYYEGISNNSTSPDTIFHVKMEVLSTLGSTNLKWSTTDSTHYNPSDQTYFYLTEDKAIITPFDALITSNTTEDDVIFEDGNGDPALPVTLESFVAEYNKGAVELVWSTASETQNAGFVLKRAIVEESVALNYVVISSYLDNDALIGAGTTTEKQRYSYRDSNVRPGLSYSYILEDVDYSGNMLQHDPVSVLVPENVLAANADFRLEPAYPNPFNPAFTLPFSLNRTMDVRIAMYDLSGRQVRSIVNSRLDAGTYSMHVDASDLNSGIYLVRSIIGDQVNTQKMLLVK